MAKIARTDEESRETSPVRVLLVGNSTVLASGLTILLINAGFRGLPGEDLLNQALQKRREQYQALDRAQGG